MLLLFLLYFCTIVANKDFHDQNVLDSYWRFQIDTVTNLRAAD